MSFVGELVNRQVFPLESAFPMARLKHAVERQNSRSDEAKDCVGLEHIESWTGRLLLDVHGADDTADATTAIDFQAGDVLFGKLRPYLAKVFRASIPGCCSAEFLVLRPRDFYSRYLRYVLLTPQVIRAVDSSTYGAKMPRASWDFIGDLRLPLPPLATQRAVADFLDRKTAALDDLISRKERLLALLAERRAALVHRAVTRGLDPDVPMKDTGVPWIGEIPAHWGLSPVKYECQLLNHLRVPLSSEERGKRQGSFPYYGASGIIDYVDDYVFEGTAVLIAEDGANLRLRNSPLAFLAQGRFWINNHAHILLPRDGRAALWASILESRDFSPWITGSAQPKLTAEALQNLVIPVPPCFERAKIETHLSTVIHEEVAVREQALAQLARLREFRQALITAAVTGQIEIPEDQP